ncbi:hypothetical protein B738_27547 [Photorhabdus temperata subsp. temperata M1021]|uniref:Uncharacterized protein n=1 Tax=Photorhabdus temperata J3 TaxID=1389415 RepID=U7QT49_PHOTE|nr:hypothetical protein B738_27547 [Photorhabdus temperata subsp. temperata M1021]ERT10295.1 hypothetical protein O185_25765 [Photorhabdus temperata J3]
MLSYTRGFSRFVKGDELAAALEVSRKAETEQAVEVGKVGTRQKQASLTKYEADGNDKTDVADGLS